MTPALAIAHRAGNSLQGLREAVALGVDVVECDVHQYRSRLEVRHLKTAGPLPFLWDRWEVAPASTARLGLRELLMAEDQGTAFMLDLKGPRTSAARSVAELLHSGGPRQPVLVCGRHWPSVKVLAALPYVRPVLSARNRVEVALLRRLLRDRPGRAEPVSWVYGVSLHLRWLEADLVAELHRTVERVLTWPVNDLPTLDRVLALGVTGVISDERTVLEELVRRNGLAR